VRMLKFFLVVNMSIITVIFDFIACVKVAILGDAITSCGFTIEVLVIYRLRFEELWIETLVVEVHVPGFFHQVSSKFMVGSKRKAHVILHRIILCNFLVPKY